MPVHGSSVTIGSQARVGAGSVCPKPGNSLRLARSDRSDGDSGSEAQGTGHRPPRFEQKVQELEEDWARFIQIQLTTETMDHAKDLARNMALRGADAVHLASALVLRRRFADAEDRLIFVASDRELKEAAQSSGLAVIDPEEQEKQTTTSPGEGAQEEDKA